jgi:phage terminase small subunit
MTLTPKQQRFVDQYLIDLNATQAAVRAGYSAKTAHSAGPRLLENVGVAAAIQAAFAARSERVQITQDQVIAEFAKIGFADLRKAVKWKTILLEPEAAEASAIDQAAGALTAVQIVELIDSAELDPATAAAISEVSQGKSGLKIKLHDKVGALTQLGRHLGMFTDKTEVSGPNGAPLEVAVVDRPPAETREEWIARRNRELGREG